MLCIVFSGVMTGEVEWAVVEECRLSLCSLPGDLRLGGDKIYVNIHFSKFVAIGKNRKIRSMNYIYNRC